MEKSIKMCAAIKIEKISIITVCFNSQNTILKTLDSVLNQTYPNLEYIVVDGGSKDGTVKILNEYKEKFKGRMTYISEPDEGIYDAFNKGIQLATGTLIGILNSDDWYEKDAAKLAAEKWSGSDYEVIYGMQRCIQDQKEKSVVFYNHQFLEEQMITHPTCFVTKKTYETFGLFNTSFKSSADYEFMLRLKQSDKVKFTPIYAIMTNFTLGGMSGSTVGTLETLKLKKSYGFIGNKQYLFQLFKVKAKTIYNKLREIKLSKCCSK